MRFSVETQKCLDKESNQNWYSLASVKTMRSVITNWRLGLFYLSRVWKEIRM